MSELLREAEARRSRRERQQARQRSRERYIQDRIGDEAVEGVKAASRGCPEPIRVVGQRCYAVDGEIMPIIEGRSPGFASYDQVISALSTGKGQQLMVSKDNLAANPVASKPYTLWQAGGLPGAGTWGTSGTGRAVTDADAGAIPFVNPTAPATMHLLTWGAGATVALGTLLLIDRLVEYPISLAATSSPTSPTIPSRDANGAALGAGVMMFFENEAAGAATAATNPTITVTYTNSAGTASRSSGAVAMEASQPVRRVLTPNVNPNIWFPMAAGDLGVRSVQTVTLSATMTTTRANLVLARPLAILPVLTANSYVERDLVLQLASMPRVFDDSYLSFLLMANTTNSSFQSRLQLAQN